MLKKTCKKAKLCNNSDVKTAKNAGATLFGIEIE